MSSRLPDLLTFLQGIEVFFVILRSALLAPVIHLIRYLGIHRRTDTDIVLPGVAFVAGDPHLVGLIVLLGSAADAADYIIRTLVFVGGGGGFLGGGLGFGGAFLAGATGALLWCLNRLVEGVEVFVLAFGGACRAAGVCLFYRGQS